MPASPLALPRRNPTRRAWLRTAGVLALPAFVPQARAASTPRFTLGVASGWPSPQGVVLWTRLMGEDLPATVAVRWMLAEDEAFQRIVARGTEQTRVDDAHSVHAEPRDLSPGRGYWYRFEALGQRSPVGRTRTAPAPDAVEPLRLVSASCQRYDHGHYAAWRDAAAQSPDLVLFLGDYIYEYKATASVVREHTGGVLGTLAEYRDRYALYKSDPHLQAAHAAAPWLLIWDDHEVENDYAGMQGSSPPSDFAIRRAAAYRAYWEHLPLPKAMRPHGADMRLYTRLDWGALARLQLLDMRQYRDPQACPRPGRRRAGTVRVRECPELLNEHRSVLGADQEAWLAQGWDHDRPWNLLVQQTLMARMSWGDPARDPSYWTDGWDGYPAARRRLLRQAVQRKAKGLVVLGGDVHTHYVAELMADFDKPHSPVIASEFCSTSISSRSSIDPADIDKAMKFNPHLLCGQSERRGYQWLELDRHRLRVTLKAVDDAKDPDSAVTDVARFVVDPRRPGPQRG